MITSDDDTSEPLDLLADSSDDPPQCARQPKKVLTAPRDYLQYLLILVQRMFVRMFYLEDYPLIRSFMHQGSH